jgi:carbon starvation protein CstA
VTICPMAFVAVTTVTAGILSIRDNFWPMTSSPEPATRLQGFTNSTLTVIMLVCVATILVAAGRRWLQARAGVVMPAVASDEA